MRCAYDYNANDAYFTNISLVLEPAETYSYDSKGNPIAATDGSAKTASEFFADSQRLKSYTTPGGAKHTLGYDASNNLQEDTLAGLTNYTYHNTSGSPTTSMTREGYQRRLPQVPKCLRQYRPFPHAGHRCKRCADRLHL